VLGTVQLGLPYGINNQLGQPSRKPALNILQCASENGNRILDSANAYGTSLEIIGDYHKTRHGEFAVISKFVCGNYSLTDGIDSVLDKAGVSQLYAYLYHRFDDYRTQLCRQELLMLKEKGKIKMIGVSLYSVDELERAIEDQAISLIQVPISPFDASPRKLELLTKARASGILVHARSVFLQGLYFKDPNTLTGNMTIMRSPLEKFQKQAANMAMSIRQACLHFVATMPFVDAIVIGVESVDQLQKNIEALNMVPQQELSGLGSFDLPDRSMLNPANWKP
jgi:aryl-alcohol dehydrogenase-like predicted oxidoreductase